ncbi:recombinase family protein [Actinomadura sp. NPDC023710]|uniref:recombinase family protein n=1 Tax=Actinomadura sp. NPDC023710 TaxID=3158219 RepID=UPI0033F6C5FE
MQWIFAQRLAGHSMARITRALNAMQIPHPSAADPRRNAHRSRQVWTLTAVRTILNNPRYTGRQVWNRRPSEHDLIDPSNTWAGTSASAAVEPARRLGHLRSPRAPGPGQRSRLHRGPGQPDPARHHRKAGSLLPTSGAAVLRDLRAPTPRGPRKRPAMYKLCVRGGT